MRRGVVAVVAILTAASTVATAQPVAPARVSDGAVVWETARDTTPAWSAGLPLPPRTRADSVAVWTRLAERPGLREMAALRLGTFAWEDGDARRADSCWATIPPPSRWGWAAMRARFALARALRDSARTDSLLDRLPAWDWSTAEQYERDHEYLKRFLARHDSLHAAWQAGRLVAQTAPARLVRDALPDLEAALAVGSGQTRVGGELAVASAEWAAGRRAECVARMKRLVAGTPAGLSAGDRLVLADRLRQMRRFVEALQVARSANDLGRGELSLARILRDAGMPDSARFHYLRVPEGATGREDAMWELARIAAAGGRWPEARDWYGRCADLRGARAGAARQQTGLVHLMEGHAEFAAAAWAEDTTAFGRFWSGVARRAIGDRTGADSSLRAVAARLAYEFHPALARDSLGLRAWRGDAVLPDSCAAETCEQLAPIEDLLALGLVADAGEALERALDDRHHRLHDAGSTLAAIRVAYACGRPARAFALVEWAQRLAVAPPGPDGHRRADPATRDSLAWTVVPWAYPPAYESLLVAPPARSADSLEPALLYAVIRQESRFDPRARSRSDALGLMQLKLGAASDVAGWVREPKPTEATLFDPETNVRYGARYLARLIRRFDGSVAAALLAYNIGPGAMPPWWREAIARGGEALLCELASNGDYARRILGYRQAYRELRPTAFAP